MPQEDVPLCLRACPLGACSREAELLLVLASKVCHSCSSSCRSGSFTLSRMPTLLGSSAPAKRHGYSSQAVAGGLPARKNCLNAREIKGAAHCMDPATNSCIGVAVESMRTSLRNTGVQGAGMCSRLMLRRSCASLSVLRSIMSSARLH